MRSKGDISCDFYMECFECAGFYSYEKEHALGDIINVFVYREYEHDFVIKISYLTPLHETKWGMITVEEDHIVMEFGVNGTFKFKLSMTEDIKFQKLLDGSLPTIFLDVDII